MFPASAFAASAAPPDLRCRVSSSPVVLLRRVDRSCPPAHHHPPFRPRRSRGYRQSRDCPAVAAGRWWLWLLGLLGLVAPIVSARLWSLLLLRLLGVLSLPTTWR